MCAPQTATSNVSTPAGSAPVKAPVAWNAPATAEAADAVAPAERPDARCTRSATSQMKASWPAGAEMVTPKGSASAARAVGTEIPQRSRRFMWFVYLPKFVFKATGSASTSLMAYVAPTVGVTSTCAPTAAMAASAATFSSRMRYDASKHCSALYLSPCSTIWRTTGCTASASAPSNSRRAARRSATQGPWYSSSAASWNGA
mmetsp:Transcript_40393/g.122029  ORF Transcript_40393/g.122029 Transcript_40393/m.122029 type:complete len:202 (+) Transcript_40393:172-777(+)